MTDEHVDFLEGSLVEELVDALTGSVFATFVLLLDGLFAASQTSFLAEGDELFYFFKLGTHYSSIDVLYVPA